MGDPAVAGSTAATDTDYTLEAMVQAFVGRAQQGADRFSSVQSDALATSAKGFARIEALAEQWMGNLVQTMPAITGAAVQAIDASTADSILNYLILGGRMAGSNPPVPSNFGVIPQGNPASGGISGGVDLSALATALQAIATKLAAIQTKLGA